MGVHIWTIHATDSASGMGLKGIPAGVLQHVGCMPDGMLFHDGMLAHVVGNSSCDRIRS